MFRHHAHRKGPCGFLYIAGSKMSLDEQTQFLTLKLHSEDPPLTKCQETEKRSPEAGQGHFENR